MSYQVFLIRAIGVVLASVVWWAGSHPAAFGEVVASADGGFSLRIQRTTEAKPRTIHRGVVESIGEWWDSAHTFSGDSSNLSMDLERRCFIEQLSNGGFARHLEIDLYQPDGKIVLTGGLGPLKELGLDGALTIQWQAVEGEESKIELTYNVSGYTPQGLKRLAPAVDQVLSQQMDHLVQWLAEQGDN